MKITKVTLGNNRGFEKETEVKSVRDILNFLTNDRHGEYVYVNYYDESGNIDWNIRYTVRCWYNEADNNDWEKSQIKNCEKIVNYLKKDKIDCIDFN